MLRKHAQAPSRRVHISLSIGALIPMLVVLFLAVVYFCIALYKFWRQRNLKTVQKRGPVHTVVIGIVFLVGLLVHHLLDLIHIFIPLPVYTQSIIRVGFDLPPFGLLALYLFDIHFGLNYAYSTLQRQWMRLLTTDIDGLDWYSIKKSTFGSQSWLYTRAIVLYLVFAGAHLSINVIFNTESRLQEAIEPIYLCGVAGAISFSAYRMRHFGQVFHFREQCFLFCIFVFGALLFSIITVVSSDRRTSFQFQLIWYTVIVGFAVFSWLLFQYPIYKWHRREARMASKPCSTDFDPYKLKLVLTDMNLLNGFMLHLQKEYNIATILFVIEMTQLLHQIMEFSGTVVGEKVKGHPSYFYYDLAPELPESEMVSDDEPTSDRKLWEIYRKYIDDGGAYAVNFSNDCKQKIFEYLRQVEEERILVAMEVLKEFAGPLREASHIARRSLYRFQWDTTKLEENL